MARQALLALGAEPIEPLDVAALPGWEAQALRQEAEPVVKWAAAPVALLGRQPGEQAERSEVLLKSQVPQVFALLGVAGQQEPWQPELRGRQHDAFLQRQASFPVA